MSRRTVFMFRDRSVVEIMVLVFTFTVIFVLVGATLVVAIAEIMDPTVDTTTTVDALIRIVSSLIAALFGLMIGQSDSLHKRPDGTIDTLGSQDDAK